MEHRRVRRHLEVTVAVKDLEPFRGPYAARSISPELVTLKWAQEGTETPSLYVEVAGHQIKKDGTVGSVWASHFGQRPADWPDWVCELINAYSPKWPTA